MAFKNTRSLHTLVPKKEFYEIFNEDQIIDMIKNIEVNKEIPHKYAYFSGGSEYWDNYVLKSLESEEKNTPKNTIELLESNIGYITSILQEFDSINIIDIGVGNSVTVKPLIDKVLELKLLRKYIGIDLSQDILKLSENNLRQWYGKDFPVEFFIKDITTDNIQEILFKNTNFDNNEKCMNLLLFVGGTITNYKYHDQPLHVIQTSMGKNDILILGQRKDTEKARLYFNYNSNLKEDTKKSKLDNLYKWILEVLNISEDLYDVEQMYLAEEHSRKISIRLNTDIQLKIKTKNFQKDVYINNRDSILLWRAVHHTFSDVINVLSEVGMEIVHASTSADEEHMLAISKIKQT